MPSPYCIENCEGGFTCWGCINLERLQNKGTDSMSQITIEDLARNYATGVMSGLKHAQNEDTTALQTRIEQLEAELAEVANRLSDEEREHNKTRIELHAYREGVQDGRGITELAPIPNAFGYQRSGWLN